MATRCNILIRHGDSRIWIYRHWDGYLSETGKDLSLMLEKAGDDPDRFLRLIMATMRDGIDNQATPVYELTTEQHGDIEFLYTFDFNALRASRVNAIVVEEVNSESSNRRKWCFSPQQFRECVNDAIDCANRHLVEMSKTHDSYASIIEKHGPEPYKRLPEVGAMGGDHARV